MYMEAHTLSVVRHSLIVVDIVVVTHDKLRMRYLFRFSADCKAMLGFEIGIYWKLCWALIGPLFILVRDRDETSLATVLIHATKSR